MLSLLVVVGLKFLRRIVSVRRHSREPRNMDCTRDSLFLIRAIFWALMSFAVGRTLAQESEYNGSTYMYMHQGQDIYCIVFIHFYSIARAGIGLSISLRMSHSETPPTTALILYRS